MENIHVKVHGQDLEVHIGRVGGGNFDWRADPPDDVDPDDVEMDTTPTDVVAILGFDPAEE